MSTVEQTERQLGEVRALRMLRAGDSIKDVHAATGLSVDDIRKLQRDFPGTQQPALVRTDARPVQIGTVTVEAPDPLGALLAKAGKHQSKRIQTLGQKVSADLDRLRALLSAEAEKAAAKRKAEEEKAWAKAEVEKLEQQLAAAKAKLRGGTVKPKPKQVVHATVSGVCAGCGEPIIRKPGQMGRTPTRCDGCR